jgi:hypothetical protein
MVNTQTIREYLPDSHAITQIIVQRKRHYAYDLRIRVLAAFLNAASLGAPLLPGFRIFSPEPSAIRFSLAWMFAYNPGFLFGIGKPFHGFLENSFVGDCTAGARGRGARGAVPNVAGLWRSCA